MRLAYVVTTGVCFFGLSAEAYAQSSDYESLRFGQSVEARVGLTIPFGGSHKKAHSKPQFALGLRQEFAGPKSYDWALRPSFEDTPVRELKLSMTMEKSPTLLLNDQLLNFDEDVLAANGTANALDKYDKTVLTVIGVSLVVIAGSIIIISD